MPTKDTIIYIGTEEDGTKVYWCPYYCSTEYHRPDGKIECVVRKHWQCYFAIQWFVTFVTCDFIMLHVLVIEQLM